jgi:hypothetical protein
MVTSFTFEITLIHPRREPNKPAQTGLTGLREQVNMAKEKAAK